MSLLKPQLSLTQMCEYLNSHTFVPHPNGNIKLFGLNEFEMNSVIKYENDIWKFWAFQENTNNAVYYNRDRKPLIINIFDSEAFKNAERMIDEDEDEE
jgi:hypothetical protein